MIRQLPLHIPNAIVLREHLIDICSLQIPLGEHRDSRPTTIAVHEVENHVVPIVDEVREHRVIRVEVNDSAYEPGSIELKAEWRARIAQLPQSLDGKPSVVRVAYRRHGEDARVAARRQAVLVKEIRAQWERLHHEYPLQVEAEDEAQP